VNQDIDLLRVHEWRRLYVRDPPRALSREPLIDACELLSRCRTYMIVYYNNINLPVERGELDVSINIVKL
jgi:hypothetical protein